MKKHSIKFNRIFFATAFFLCTPPLCAQEKVLDRMTRSEARQEILRHTEIKDHVTFYHSNDKDIYVVYDLASSGNKEKMLQGKTILLGILDAFESTRNQSRPLEVSFFAREKFFDAIRILKENKLMDAELRQQSESLVSQMSFCEERGPNNRAANYAMGALAAARLFPKHKDAKLWKAYAEVCTWYGAVRFASESKNKELSRQLQERFDYLCTAEKDFLPIKNHVDLNMFGCLPLELYQITKKIQYLDLGISYADTQWELPAEASAEEKRWADKGLSWQTRLWIDDMYMITILQSQAYRATGNRKYIDRTARSMAVYLDELQRPNGLFYHAPDVPFLWGRGNGWMAAGMARTFESIAQRQPGSSAYPTGVSRYDEKFKTISGRKRYVEPVDRRSRLLE